MATTHKRSAEVIERADELIVGAMNVDAAPGMGVGIVRGPETIYAKGFGLADAGRGKPVSPRTRALGALYCPGKVRNGRVSCRPQDERGATWSEESPEGGWRRYSYEEIMRSDGTNLDLS